MTLLQVIKQAALDAVRESMPVEIVVGTVESASPLKIRLDQRTLLDEDFLILTREVKDYTVDMTVEGGTRRTYTVHNALKKGEKCFLLMKQGGNDYIVLCRES